MHYDYNYIAIKFINGNNQIIRREQSKKGYSSYGAVLIIGMKRKMFPLTPTTQLTLLS